MLIKIEFNFKRKRAFQRIGGNLKLGLAECLRKQGFKFSGIWLAEKTVF